MSLSLVGMLLAGCGAVATQTWPGLTGVDNMAYVAQGPQVFAIDSVTGRQVWAFPPAPDTSTGAMVSQPGVSDDVVVVGSEGPTGSYSGVLYGLDRATGQQLWCLAFDQKGVDREGCPLARGEQPAGVLFFRPAIDNRVIGGIAVADGTAYFGLANGRVFAVDVATGRDLWSFPAGRDVWATPVVTEDTVFVASLDHTLYALDRDNGQVSWQRDMGAALAGTPLLIDDTLYVGTFGDQLAAIDAATGQDRWPPFATSNWVWSGPAEQDGILYFTDVGGTVYAVNSESGQQVWQPVRPGGIMRARPVVTADSVIVGDRDGNLFALDRATGATRWTEVINGQLLGGPVLSGDVVVVAPFNGDNVLAGYSAASGDLVWAFAPSR